MAARINWTIKMVAYIKEQRELGCSFEEISENWPMAGKPTPKAINRAYYLYRNLLT